MGPEEIARAAKHPRLALAAANGSRPRITNPTTSLAAKSRLLKLPSSSSASSGPLTSRTANARLPAVPSVDFIDLTEEDATPSASRIADTKLPKRLASTVDLIDLTKDDTTPPRSNTSRGANARQSASFRTPVKPAPSTSDTPRGADTRQSASSSASATPAPSDSSSSRGSNARQSASSSGSTSTNPEITIAVDSESILTLPINPGEDKIDWIHRCAVYHIKQIDPHAEVKHILKPFGLHGLEDDGVGPALLLIGHWSPIPPTLPLDKINWCDAVNPDSMQDPAQSIEELRQMFPDLQHRTGKIAFIDLIGMKLPIRGMDGKRLNGNQMYRNLPYIRVLEQMFACIIAHVISCGVKVIGALGTFAGSVMERLVSDSDVELHRWYHPEALYHRAEFSKAQERMAAIKAVADALGLPINDNVGRFAVTTSHSVTNGKSKATYDSFAVTRATPITNGKGKATDDSDPPLDPETLRLIDEMALRIRKAMKSAYDRNRYQTCGLKEKIADQYYNEPGYREAKKAYDQDLYYNGGKREKLLEPVRCTVCLRLLSSIGFETHTKTCLTQKPIVVPFECGVCEETFSIWSLPGHTNSKVCRRNALSKGLPLPADGAVLPSTDKCPFCSLELNYKRLGRHLREEYGGAPQTPCRKLYTEREESVMAAWKAKKAEVVPTKVVPTKMAPNKMVPTRVKATKGSVTEVDED